MRSNSKIIRERRLKEALALGESTGRFYLLSGDWENEGIVRCGVKKQKNTEEREILIVGSGRCGTHYFSRVLKNNGLDVPHERVGLEGTSSHWFICDSEWYPILPFTSGFKAHVGQRKSDYCFKNTIHLVREPCKTIQSITNIFRRTDLDFLFENKIIPDNIKLTGRRRWFRGMIVYYYVNKWIMDHFVGARVIKLEEIKKHIKIVSAMLGGVPLTLKNEKPSNTSKNILGYKLSKEKVTFSTLKATDYSLAEKIYWLGKILGYDCV